MASRIRYRFTYSGSAEAALGGTESISQILRMPVVHILGQQSYLSGGQAAVRVVVTDSKNDPIAGPGWLRIELSPPGQNARVLFTGRLNRRGSAEAQFRFPAGLAGSYPLRYFVDTPIGSAEFSQPVRLEDKVSILLTTEKPIYQPGQTIHVRALALDRANHEAAGGRKLTFEVEDSRGNKVLKKATETDKFGIASAEFGLADEVNLGTYHVRALMEDGPAGSKNSGELALNVERYVLPKFKVAVDFGAAENKAKRGYRPGDHVTGTVRANYFFGKAVDNGEVTVKASGMDVAMFQAGGAQGKTDADGAYRFDLQLPTYFAGRPLSQGAARVLVEATVKDAAGHSETRGEPITVSQSPLILTAVPEGGTLIPGLENQVFILAAYPDGSPAVADLAIHAAGIPDRNVTTDQSGVAEIPLRVNGGTEALRIDASDKEGNRASSNVQLQARNGCGPDSAARGPGRLPRRRPHRSEGPFDQAARDGVSGRDPGRADRADARRGHCEWPGGAGPDGHRGSGRRPRLQRLSLRKRRAPGGGSPVGVRTAGGRAEDRGYRRCRRVQARRRSAHPLPRDGRQGRGSAGRPGAASGGRGGFRAGGKAAGVRQGLLLPGTGGHEAPLRNPLD